MISLPQRVLASALLVLGVQSVAGCAQGPSKDFRFHSANKLGSLIQISERKPAETFTGALLSGGTFTLASTAGSVVVLNFWAVWCPPCVIETPQLDSLYRADKDHGVDVIGIDIDSERDAVTSFVRDNKISYPIVLDEQARTAVALGGLPVKGIPFSVLIDKLGRVAAVYTGPVTPADLQPVLTRLGEEA
jgi:thiol-disulfide isomerase/thioredoxin